MNYRITQNGIALPGKFFDSAQDAWHWIRDELNRYLVQGLPAPTLRVTFGGTMVDIEGKPITLRKHRKCGGGEK